MYNNTTKTSETENESEIMGDEIFGFFFFNKYKILKFKYSWLLFCLVQSGPVHYGTTTENIRHCNTSVTFSNACGTYKQRHVHGQEMYSCSLFYVLML